MTTITPTTPIAVRRSTRVDLGLGRAVHAELVKLARPRHSAVIAAVVAVLAIGGTALGLLTVDSAGPPSGNPIERPLTVEALAEPGGGTALFSQTTGFLSVFLLAVFIGVIAGEFTRGTFRTMLLQQPRRFTVLGGKLIGLFTITATALVTGAVVTWITARVMAPSQGVDPAAWWSVDGLLAGLEDVGRAFGFLAVTLVLATAVGVITRSIPVGVGAALIWLGPIENIVGEDLDAGPKYFPGLLLRAIINEGSTPVSTARAAVTLALYSVIALAVTVVVVRRRDVTS